MGVRPPEPCRAPDVDGAIHRFRDQLGGVIRRRGLAGLLAAIITQVTWCVVLIIALRIVGVSDDVLTAAEIFAVYALVNVITIIPMSPGGAGIPELLYIAGMTTIAGSGYESLITAGSSCSASISGSCRSRSPGSSCSHGAAARCFRARPNCAHTPSTTRPSSKRLR